MQADEEQELIGAFADAVRRLPGAAIERIGVEEPSAPHRYRADALVDATIAGQELVFLVEAKRRVLPRDVRETIWRLRDYCHTVPTDRRPVPILISQAVSPSARELLRTEGIGYFDTGGSLYLPTPGAYVLIDRPPPKRQAKAFAAIFRGRKAVVCRMVYALRHEWLSVKELAERSEVSPATVSETLTELERREWVTSQGNGPAKTRRLVEPDLMLEAWRQDILANKPHRLHRYFVPADGGLLLQRLATEFDSRHMPYAITAEAAAQAYAPHLTAIPQVRCRSLPNAARHDVLAAIGARPVSEGWNLAMIDAAARSDFSDCERLDGVCYASPLQTYLDLLKGSGRAPDMAEHLRRERLRA